MVTRAYVVFVKVFMSHSRHQAAKASYVCRGFLEFLPSFSNHVPGPKIAITVQKQISKQLLIQRERHVSEALLLPQCLLQTGIDSHV
jgi:hypothetical protein